MSDLFIPREMLRRTWLLAALLLGLAGRAAAQTTPADTTRLHYREETAPAPPADAALLVQRPDRDQWKLGLNNFIVNGYPFSQTKDVPGYYTRYGLHLAYERRLGRAWSGQVEISPAITHYRPQGASGPVRPGAQLRGQLAGRYYHNLERRLRQGYRTAGFSANYVSLALGVGVGEALPETPFYLLGSGRGPAADVALLYGLQRRLGRYGFVDINLGVSGLLWEGQLQKISPAASLRLGLALPALGSEAPLVAAPDEVNTLLPRFFVGLQFGDSRYYIHNSRANPYPASYRETTNGYEKSVNYGSFAPEYTDPVIGRHEHDNDGTSYLYGGYYFTPRLAVQLGAQYGVSTRGWPLGTTAGVRRAGEDWRPLQNRELKQYLLATPVQVRYALTRAFRRRLQVEVVGGLTPVWSRVRFREYETAGYAVTDQVKTGFERTALGLTANLGGSLGYSLDRRRRLQATLDYGLLQDLHSLLSAPSPFSTYAKIGVRYRFGYR